MVINKVKVALLSLTLIFFSTTCIFAYLWWTKTCPEATEVVRVTHDTIYPKDITPKPISVKVPEAYKAVAVKNVKLHVAETKPTPVDAQKKGIITTPESKVNNMLDQLIANDSFPAQVTDCDSIRYYRTDTTIKDNCHIIVNDTVDGKIIGQSIWYANLTPRYETTVEKILKEKVKVYIGADFTFNARYQDRWGAGPAALLTIPRIGGVSYYYDIRNNAHTGGFYALLRFHR